MNNNAITEDIKRLSDEWNTWSSTLCIPVSDSEDFLDINSAAKGYNSSIPPGATNQPDTFPTGKVLISCYRFDPEIFKHESSWDDLRSILRDAASGCNLSIHKTMPQNIMRKKYYVLGCHHSRVQPSTVTTQLLVPMMLLLKSQRGSEVMERKEKV
jgi:hypothetical protein